MNDYVSIIYVMFRTGLNNRGVVAKRCLKSLLDNTLYPYELILVDNSYNNRGLSKARNWAIEQATGKYVAIVDDDVLFRGDWLTRCVELVERGDKYIATPIHQRVIGRWELSSVDGYRHNYRTGSNCMVMRRSDLDKIGRFDERKIVGGVGSPFAKAIVRAGYSFLIAEPGLAKDIGVGKHSYDPKTQLELKREHKQRCVEAKLRRIAAKKARIEARK